MNAADKLELEKILDRTSPSALLEELAVICHGKAEHLQSTWQDDFHAKLWTKAGERIEKVAAEQRIVIISYPEG